MRRRRFPQLIVVPAALALALAACGGDAEETPTGTETDTPTGTETGAGDEGLGTAVDLVTPQTLTVCSDVPYAPFEMEDESTPSGYTGFDIDLMQEMADRLGLDLAVVDAGFDAIQSGQALSAGQCDVAASAMTITAEREENVDFSDPYFEADQSLLIRAEDEGDYESLEDLAGQTIGVQADTTGQDYAEENAPDDVNVTAYPDASALFNALEAGEIEAILQDFPVNAYRAEQDDSVVVAETFETDEQYGFATREEGADELIKKINEELAEMLDDGTYDDIHTIYFGEPPAGGRPAEATPTATGS